MKTIIIITLALLALWTTACSSVPMITVPEAEYDGLNRQVRLLTRELSDAKEDFEKERQEQLKSREYLRKVEHPLTLKEEQERGRCMPQVSATPQPADFPQLTPAEKDYLELKREVMEYCNTVNCYSSK